MTSPETSRTERISTFFHTALGWYWFFCGCLWCFCCFLCRESLYLPHSPRRSAAVLIACSSAFENILRRAPCAAAQSHYWLCAAPVSITAFWPQGARCSTLPSLCSRPWPSSFFPFSSASSASTPLSCCDLEARSPTPVLSSSLPARKPQAFVAPPVKCRKAPTLPCKADASFFFVGSWALPELLCLRVCV